VVSAVRISNRSLELMSHPRESGEYQMMQPKVFDDIMPVLTLTLYSHAV
jgi:hypothetical protein